MPYYTHLRSSFTRANLAFNKIMTLLHYQYQTCPNPAASTMLFIHGLFGDLNNLGIIARAFSEQYHILRVDLRNHGQSFHSDQMDYPTMAQDVLELLHHLKLHKVIVIGHSMGGKTAMMLTYLAPHLIEKLVVIDMAPITYTQRRHDNVFRALFAIKSSRPENRQMARVIMQQFNLDDDTLQFMLKSFDANAPECFRFNLSALFANYDNISDWMEINVSTPTLFIKGGNSDYIQAKDSAAVLRQFSQAKSFVIANVQHWVHAEKPDAVIRAMNRFI